MNLYVGVTDNQWFKYLSEMEPPPDEVNFLPAPAMAKDELDAIAKVPRYGSEYLARPRLGQGSFRVSVIEAYQRRCAMTGGRALPALHAGHIKPYGKSGPHRVSNGLPLRADLHALFDQGYITVTPDHRVEVSRRIKEEFDNGEEYFTLRGLMVWIEVKVGQPFDREQLQRTPTIADLCSADLFAPLFGHRPNRVLKLGSKRHRQARRERDFIDWEDVARIAAELLPHGEGNYTVQALRRLAS